MQGLDSAKTGERRPKVRATGVLIRNREILLVKQALREQSHWNLPGGGLEEGDSLGRCLVCEMEEETGLHVEVGDLLYVCDRFKSMGAHVLDISFQVSCCDDGILSKTCLDTEDERLDSICMVPLDMLACYGFSEKFIQLARDGFPGKGSYQGDFHGFYGRR